MEDKIVGCELCPRLRKHCAKIAAEKRKSFMADDYWGQPVPNFGKPGSDLLIVGLAPAAHGANRTGRMFTGDRSGEWLYRALYKAGFANQPLSENKKDGLILRNTLITAVAHCAPPDNKPTSLEIKNCEKYLDETFDSGFKVVIALGSIAWSASINQLKRLGCLPNRSQAKMKFSHGCTLPLQNSRILIGSYHPSQQNTFTGRLTEPMFDEVFLKAKLAIKKASKSEK